MIGRTIRYISILLATGLTAGTGAGAASRPERLIELWKEQNTLCRGLPGDSPQSQAACAERQRIGRKLGQLGWCYGEEGQMAYQMVWHKCRAASLRPQ